MAAVPPYGVAIHQARSSGDLAQMRKVAAEADAHLAKQGGSLDGLKELKAEIARIEASGKGR
ncbi:MAG: hypothetical protein QOI73_228 [Solirubrobacteraceae bacterium]|nr:hypothetical protein [Solirubrobacteraceae bacterium]